MFDFSVSVLQDSKLFTVDCVSKWIMSRNSLSECTMFSNILSVIFPKDTLVQFKVLEFSL